MGGYIAAVILAGPSVALTATATYPVLGAVLALVAMYFWRRFARRRAEAKQAT